MSDDAVVHLEVVLGADIMVWRSGMATVCVWDDATNAKSPSARELAEVAGVEEVGA